MRETFNINRKETVEQKERPKYRYYFHGTFMPFINNIEREGFKYTEYNPNLTISPSYGLDFAEGEVAKGEESLRRRSKHLNKDKKNGFISSSLNLEDSVLLVIEPPVGLEVHTTNQGRPNVFSTPDQIPDDLEGSIRSRIFVGKQYEIRGTPFTKIREGEVKHPGMNLNQKRIITEDGKVEWIKIDPSKRLNISGILPANCVKIIIPRNEKFRGIFSRLKEDLRNGNLSGDVLENYTRQLFDYLRHEKVEIKTLMSEADLKEVANNMAMGEIEHYIVSEIRSLYLLTEKYKGKKIFSTNRGKETEQLTDNSKTDLLEKIKEKINGLRKLKPSNEVLNRYINIYCAKFESEIVEENNSQSRQ